MVTVDDVRAVVKDLPRSYEVVVRGRTKFRVGQIVYLSFSKDETRMGFAFPKEWRDVLVGSDPAKFSMPRASDLRFNWVVVSLAAIDVDEMRELVLDAWTMVVPKFVAAEVLGPPEAARQPERRLRRTAASGTKRKRPRPAAS